MMASGLAQHAGRRPFISLKHKYSDDFHALKTCDHGVTSLMPSGGAPTAHMPFGVYSFGLCEIAGAPNADLADYPTSIRGAGNIWFRRVQY